VLAHGFVARNGGWEPLAGRHNGRVLRRLIALGTVVIGVLELLGMLGELHWRLDLLAHFRVQALLGLLVLAGVAAAARIWRWAGIAGGLVAVNLVMFAPYLGPLPAASGPRLALLHFNVLSSNARYDEVVAWIAGSAADVVFVQEVDPRWAGVLAAVPGYRLLDAVPRTDNFGLAVLVRGGIPGEAVRAAPVRGLPVFMVTMQHAGRELAILSVHTLPPMTADYAATRDEQLIAAAAWAREQQAAGRAPVVIGDLNATPFSAAMAPLADVAFLRDGLRGGLRVFVGTWPAWPWPLRIAIDHCWHADTLVMVDRVVGPDLGSDHRPLGVSLAWVE